ncbi:MAG: ABC transporter permease [Castellaniella sp.]|uniref:ABC transporter permease n=1 Tax=Castellaniella sp. TaxID=1955812 RepID=UPI0011FB5C21|nr:ABC transporter permease [Castellaniella sp.]TAN29535.1 MAG: ABC transporter permease [Castellaniella sp.]
MAHTEIAVAHRPLPLAARHLALPAGVWQRGTRAVFGLGGLALFVVIWKLAQESGLGHHGTIPDPFALPEALASEWRSGRLMAAVESSLAHYGWGLLMGTALGAALGLVCALSTTLEALLAGVVRVLRPIPPLAWVIFAIAWFKISHEGAAFVISIGVFWVNYFATYSAVRNVDPKYDELARAFGQGAWYRRLPGIILPASAPGILAGMHTGIGSALMALIAAELIGMPGIGQEMNVAAGVGDYATVAVYMLVISAIYAVCDSGFVYLEKKVLQWRPS